VLPSKQTAELSEIARKVEAARKAQGGGMRGTEEQQRDEMMRRLDEYAVDVCFDPSERDHPLVLRYLVPEDFTAPLALPKVSPQLEAARAQIAAIALDKARHEQPWVSYSRNHNHYAQRGSRYDERPDLYRYGIIPPTVDVMAANGYLISVVAPPDPHCGWQSVFRAAPELIEALGPAAPPLAKPKNRALIRLRDENKQLTDFRDTERTARMRRHLIEINEAIGELAIELPAGCGERYGDVLTIGGSCVNLSSTKLRRIFNVDFKNGGRSYGHFVQNMPKAIRAQLTIGGEPVAEPDYRAHHLMILYGLCDLPLPGDPYVLDNWDRGMVKLAVLILINAPTLQSAVVAIRQRYGINGRTALRLIDAIKARHAPIEAYFHSGAGRWLQRIDADMAERVLLGLIRQGCPALPIHDSFVVPARHDGFAREQMVEAFETVIARDLRVSRIYQVFQ